MARRKPIKEKPKLVCPHCKTPDMTFISTQALKTHLRKKHGGEPYPWVEVYLSPDEASSRALVESALGWSFMTRAGPSIWEVDPGRVWPDGVSMNAVFVDEDGNEVELAIA